MILPSAALVTVSKRHREFLTSLSDLVLSVFQIALDENLPKIL